MQENRRRPPPPNQQTNEGRRRNFRAENTDYRFRHRTDPEVQENNPEQSRTVEINKRYQFERYVGSLQYKLSGNLQRIKFCYQNPYNLQIKYMEHVLKCLDQGKHCLIQSPTGSGKTLCLLSSVLAWVHYDNKKKKQQKAPWTQFTNKVIYLSKTHSQIAQVGQQLQKTCYRPTMAVLGSRQKLCINPRVMNIKDSSEQNKKCNEAIRNNTILKKINKLTPAEFQQLGMPQQQYTNIIKNSCNMYKQYEERKYKYKKVFKLLEDDVVSIDDERNQNQQMNICPYFYPGTGKYYANLVLMPYNYLTSSRLLKRYSSIINNSIIIFDQGHNILRSMQQGASFQFRHTIFQNVIKDLQKILKQFHKKQKDIPKEKLSFDAQDIQSRRAQQEHKKDKQRQVKQAAIIKQILEQIIIQLKKLCVNFQDYCLRKARIMSKKKQTSQDDNKQIKQCIRSIKSREEILLAFFGEGLIQEKCIQKLQSYSIKLQDIYIYQHKKSKGAFGPFLVISLAETIKEIVDILCDQQKLEHYALFMYYQDLWKIQETQWKMKMVLQCFNPKFMFQKIMDKSPKSLIITSGTLSPLPSWKVATGLGQSLQDFSNNNDHVIKPDQTKTVLVSSIDKSPLRIVTRGDDKQTIKNAYKTIKIICQNTPHGVLVVVGSKKWEEKFEYHHLKQLDASQRIKKKKIFFESKQDARKINDFLDTYSQAANSQGGAVLFLICRGKLSEGIDFKDNMARAVIMVGIPLKNFTDPYIKQHKLYCDRQRKKDIKQNRLPLHQSGDDWQDQEVIRSINQSIGRVIRNSNDFGMIFLVDERYSQQWEFRYNFKSSLSGWACKQVSQRYIDANQIPLICNTFFNVQRINGRMP